MFLSKKLLLFLLNREKTGTVGTQCTAPRGWQLATDSGELGELREGGRRGGKGQRTSHDIQQGTMARKKAEGRISFLHRSCFRTQVRFPGNPKHLDCKPGSTAAFTASCEGAMRMA